MNLNKSYEFFNPNTVNAKIHIVGCGSVGSTIAENLVRFGITDLCLWDFDTVESHNIVNQMYRFIDVGKPKVEALAEQLLDINPDLNIKTYPRGWNGQPMSGYIFMAVDSMEIRKKIIEVNKPNRSVKAVFDFRTDLTSAQHYCANWSDADSIANLIASMNFSDEEADAATTVSACGVVLGVATTVRTIVAHGVNNFINFVKNGEYEKLIITDPFSHSVLCI